MDISEEMVKKNMSEGLADNNKTEGEITDDAAGDVVGGKWEPSMERVPHNPHREDDHTPSLSW